MRDVNRKSKPTRSFHYPGFFLGDSRFSVILSAAKRREESKVSARKAAMSSLNPFGFFAFGSE